MFDSWLAEGCVFSFLCSDLTDAMLFAGTSEERGPCLNVDV